MQIDTRESITLSDANRKKVAARIKAAVSFAKERNELLDADHGKFQTRSERNLALVSSSYWRELGKTSVKHINYLRTALEIKHGLLTTGDSEFLLSARRDEFRNMQESTQADFNNLWSAREFDKQTDRALWDSFIHPSGGVVELAWEYKDSHFEEYHARPDEADIIDAETKDGNIPDQAPMLAPDGQMLGIPADEYDWPLDAITALGEGGLSPMDLPEPEVDAPSIERFDPRELLIDPACTGYDLSTARYTFRYKRALLSQVKANKRLKGTTALHGGDYLYWKPSEENKKPSGVVADDILRTEIFDGYCYLNLGHGEQMYHIVWSGETNKELLCEPYRIKSFAKQDNPFPFEIMPAIVTDNDSLDMTCDVESVRDLQVNHDLAYTQLETARARGANILLAPEELFDGDAGMLIRKKIEKGEENTVLPLPATVNPDAIRWLQRPPPHMDTYRELEAIPTKILGHIGVNEYQGNMLPQKQMTKYEASQVAVQGGNRQQRETERYYDFLKRVAYKVLLLNQEFTARPREFTYTGMDGEPQQGTVTMETLRGVVPGSATPDNPLGDLYEAGIQFALDIDISKKQSRDQIGERQDLIGLMRELAPVANMPDPRLPSRPLVDIPGLLRALIKRFELTDIDNIIPPAPTDEEKQQFAMQQQQQAMAAQGNPTMLPGGMQ